MIVIETPDFETVPDALASALLGAATALHDELGSGFLKPVYCDALEQEFAAAGIPHVRECLVPILYRGKLLSTCYRADFVCYGSVIVELQALQSLSAAEDAQVRNHLKASGLAKALLLNFGTPASKSNASSVTDNTARERPRR